MIRIVLLLLMLSGQTLLESNWIPCQLEHHPTESSYVCHRPDGSLFRLREEKIMVMRVR